MELGMLSLGVDIGSIAVKLVLTRDGEIVKSSYRRFDEGPFETLFSLLNENYPELKDQSFCLGLTGIGAKVGVSVLGGKAFGEIAAIARGNFQIIPQVRTVIEMGGEDSKLLILDGSTRTVLDFAMNAQCAAGTGSFLDQQAGRLKINIETEFGQLALKSVNPPSIAGRCSVFAKSDMIHLQQIATPDYDIVAGLCFAVARNFKSAIARGKKFDRPIAFVGGVAANPGMVRAFTEILGLEPGELIIPDYFNVIGALGVSLLAGETGSKVDRYDPDRIKKYLEIRRVAESGQETLSFDHPDSKFYAVTKRRPPADYDGLEVFLGLDVGSLSTNLVLIDNDYKVISRRYLMTEGRPIEAIRRGLAEISEEVGDRVIVKAVGTTGSGRYLIGDYVGADSIKNEITAQATAAVAIDPTVDTIFEIGGQDSKYISLDNKVVIDFEMNKACAAGTGSFLQEQAEKLHINIESEFGDKALMSECPVGCGERCTVFMESDLVAHQRSGANKDDLVAGLAYSIAKNYLTKVVGDRKIGKNIFFQGGVAWNHGVVAAFEKLIGRPVTVPPHHDVIGAIGAAMIAIEKTTEPDFKTRFKGFDLHKRQYELSTFSCDDCDNSCEIRKVDIEGEAPLYYGSRCEKYDVDTRRKSRPNLPDYMTLRNQALNKRYLTFDKPRQYRGRVGIPRVLNFYEHYPFWLAFFESLQFQVVASNVSNQAVVEQSLELFAAETCFPIKLVYGHVANLIDKNVDILFLPSLISTEGEDEPEDDKKAYACPYIQMVASSVKARFDFEKEDVRLVDTPVYFSFDPDQMFRKIRPMAKELRVTERKLRLAIVNGLSAFKQFKAVLQNHGQKVLDELEPDEKVMVIVSRPYNGCDRRLSLELPKKVRNLGYKVLPMDFLSASDNDHGQDNMYWRYGRRILSVARYVRNHPNLYAIYITSFGCGPDSFITHFFRRSMSGKPYLQVEVDEHSADAGLITRAEAFVDSLRFYRFKPSDEQYAPSKSSCQPREKTVWIPHMCDHAYAIRAAMERCGLKARVMDEPDMATVDVGKKFCSGKECFPCVITTGDMIKKLKEPGFDSSQAVFFMPGATGPCRFGQYSKFHRVVLDDLGYKDVPIYSPNSDDGYAQFGLDGSRFRTLAWKGVVFIDCITKLLHAVRPYETTKGEAEKAYFHYLSRMDHILLNDLEIGDLAEEAGKAFADIKRTRQDRPMVGVVGEIYLRNNRFSNNHLIEKLEQLGLEVWLATFAEWPLYTSHTYLIDSMAARQYKSALHAAAQIFVQSRQEKKIINRINRHFHMRHELSTRQVLNRAERYIPTDCKGEAILSVGKAIEMVEQGCAGVVNAMPFNCMPGTIVSSLSGKIADDCGGAPWLNISYEGLQDSGEDTRLEAFADQVKSFARVGMTERVLV